MSERNVNVHGISHANTVFKCAQKRLNIFYHSNSLYENIGKKKRIELHSIKNLTASAKFIIGKRVARSLDALIYNMPGQYAMRYRREELMR
jgi:hypothetical protein